jgi:hypothetical protein
MNSVRKVFRFVSMLSMYISFCSYDYDRLLLLYEIKDTHTHTERKFNRW